MDSYFLSLAKCVIKIKSVHFADSLEKNSANYLNSVEEAFTFHYESYAKFTHRDN